MNAQERRIVAALYALAMRGVTRERHPAIVVTTERFGHCKPWKPCGETCRRMAATLREAEALLAESAIPVLQLAMEVAS